MRNHDFMECAKVAEVSHGDTIIDICDECEMEAYATNNGMWTVVTPDGNFK